MDVICKNIYETKSSVSECIKELAPLLDLKNFSFTSLEEDVRDVSNKINLIKKESEDSGSYSTNGAINDRDIFIKKIQELANIVITKGEFLQKEHHDLKRLIKQVYLFFGEPEESKLAPEEFLGYIIKFLKAFEVLFKINIGIV